MPEFANPTSQVNLSAPNISSGGVYHNVSESFSQAAATFMQLDRELRDSRIRQQASRQFAADAMSYTAELTDLQAKVTDPYELMEASKGLANKYLFENDKTLLKTMHPKALALYKQDMQGYVIPHFRNIHEQSLKAAVQSSITGLTNTADVHLADAAAVGVGGIGLAGHVDLMFKTLDGLPATFVDKEKVKREYAQKLLKAMGESHARQNPEETLTLLTPDRTAKGDKPAPSLKISIPRVGPDGKLDPIEDDVLKLDPGMNDHLWVIALQTIDRRNAEARAAATASSVQHDLDSEKQFGEAVSRLLAGDVGVAEEISLAQRRTVVADPTARVAIEGQQLNQLREIETGIAKKRAEGGITTKAGYASALEKIQRGDPDLSVIANAPDLNTDDAKGLMSKLFTEKQRMKDEAYSDYKTSRNHAEDTIRAFVKAKNPMAAFGEINPVAEMLVAKFRNTMGEKEQRLQQSKASGDAWRQPSMNPTTFAMDLMIEQEPILKQQFNHDAEKLITSLAQYMPVEGMNYRSMKERIVNSSDNETNKKMMLALLYQAHAQGVKESEFEAVIKRGLVPGKDAGSSRDSETVKEMMRRWLSGVLGGQ